MKDLELLAGNFLSGELPPHKTYLAKYFDKHQQILVVYLLTFPYQVEGSMQYWGNFMDHTGIACCERWFYKIVARFRRVEGRLARAEAEGDYETVSLIKTGGFRKRKGKWPEQKRKKGQTWRA